MYDGGQTKKRRDRPNHNMPSPKGNLYRSEETINIHFLFTITTFFSQYNNIPALCMAIYIKWSETTRNGSANHIH